MARAWLAHWRTGRSERYVDYVVSRLEGDIFPEIGSRPVAELTAHAEISNPILDPMESAPSSPPLEHLDP